MKYNKLLSRTYRASQHPTAIDEQRCSGRTTALAMQAIAEALQNPCEWIDLVDHHKGYMGGDNVKNMAASIVQALDYKFFEYRCGRNSRKGNAGGITYQLRCNQFTDNPWSIA